MYQNGAQIGFNVFCRVTAKPEFEDEFIRVTERSNSTVVYPKVSKNNSFDADLRFVASETPDALGVGADVIGITGNNVSTTGNVFNIDGILGLHSRFFVEDALASVDSTLAPMIFSTVEDSTNPADIISSGYTVLNEEYFPDISNPTVKEGYIIDIAGLNTTTPLAILYEVFV